MLNSDCQEFAALLNANGVEYLVVGAYALAAPGHPRYTGGIDFCLSDTPGNSGRLLQAFADFGFASLGLRVADFAPDTVIQLGQPPRHIDLLTGIDGVDFAGCWGRRETLQLDGVQLGFIGLEDFKTNQRAAGSAEGLGGPGSAGCRAGAD